MPKGLVTRSAETPPLNCLCAFLLNILIPVQTLGELFRVLTGKAHYPADEARTRILQWSDSFEVADSSWQAFQSAFDLSVDHALQI